MGVEEERHLALGEARVELVVGIRNKRCPLHSKRGSRWWWASCGAGISRMASLEAERRCW